MNLLKLSTEIAKDYSSPAQRILPSSPKYDELKLVCGLRVCIVGFRGGALYGCDEGVVGATRQGKGRYMSSSKSLQIVTVVGSGGSPLR